MSNICGETVSESRVNYMVIFCVSELFQVPEEIEIESLLFKPTVKTYLNQIYVEFDLKISIFWLKTTEIVKNQ